MANTPPRPRAQPWFAPVVKLARHLFVEQVQLKRDGGKILVVLQDPKQPAPESSKDQASTEAQPASARQLGSAQVKRMQEALRITLDQHGSARTVMRHLIYCEHTLRHQGLAGLHALPIDLLQTAMKQLDSVNTPAAPPGLAELQACLLVTLVERDSDADEPDTVSDHVDTGTGLSDFHVGDKLEVSEVSHSDFIEIAQGWPETEPG